MDKGKNPGPAPRMVRVMAALAMTVLVARKPRPTMCKVVLNKSAMGTLPDSRRNPASIYLKQHATKLCLKRLCFRPKRFIEAIAGAKKP
jgi:hypothetical protein